MFSRVMQLILALASSIGLGDSESVRAAVLSGLTSLAALAKATPGVWDDLLVSGAVMFVNSSAWDLIWKRIVAERSATVPMAAAEADSELAAAFYACVTGKV
jgi:hypothetical protein